MVPPAGFEPTTVRLEGGCSIQLSYGGTRDALNYSEAGIDLRPLLRGQSLFQVGQQVGLILNADRESNQPA
jgi:hypothetical protein